MTSLFKTVRLQGYRNIFSNVIFIFSKFDNQEGVDNQEFVFKKVPDAVALQRLSLTEILLQKWLRLKEMNPSPGDIFN